MPRTASRLRAKDPSSAEPSKPKIVIFGPSGVGKTWFALGFPNVYYISPELGADRRHYTERLKAGGGCYMGPEEGALDFEVVIEQIKALASEKHPYRTLVIDSITELFNSAVAGEAERLGTKNAFGADRKPAIANMRRLVHAITRLDMNVILVCHEKGDWGVDGSGQRVEIGKAPDCWDKLVYYLDLTLQMERKGKGRYARVRKTRLTGFPEGETFELDYSSFATRYGKDVIEKAVAPVSYAMPEQVAEIARLIALLEVPDTTEQSWLKAAGAESWEDVSPEQASKTITNLAQRAAKKINTLTEQLQPTTT